MVNMRYISMIRFSVTNIKAKSNFMSSTSNTKEKLQNLMMVDILFYHKRVWYFLIRS